MSKINVKYMTDEALDTLKANIPIVTDNFRNNPDDSSWLRDVIPSSVPLYVTKKFEIEDFTLELPRDSRDREMDIKNSILLYERLKNLPKYVLTDERFWVWFSFDKAYAVALKNMPVDSGKNIFKDHWLLTQGKRRGLFFGAMSRCFFRVALTVDETLEDPYEYTKFVIENPERFRNLSWRTFSSERKIVLGALKGEKRAINDFDVVERAEYYTELTKEISKLGSIMMLDVMSEKDINEFVYLKYKKMIHDLRNDSNIQNKDNVEMGETEEYVEQRFDNEFAVNN